MMKQSIFCLFTVLLCVGTAASESNFDFFFKSAAQYKDVVIKEIVSTDTFVLQEEIGGTSEVIKLIGLRAPKPPKRKKNIKRGEYGFVIKEPVNPLTPIEEQVFESVRELLEGKHVRLEFDAEKNGEKHETLAYVFLLEDETFVNAKILRYGFANLSIRPPNTKYAEELREAYKEARIEQRGLQGQ